MNLSRFTLQVFAEAYNLTNYVYFSGTYTRYETPKSGKPLAAGAPRKIQFGIRLDF